VTSTANQKHSVDLSPDASQIVLSQDTDNDQRFEIWILNRDGTNARRLVDDVDGPSGFEFDNRDVDWSPEGTTITFTSRRTDIRAPLDQTDLELTTTPVIGGPLMQVTRDINDDFTPYLASRDLSVWYSKLIGGVRQLFLAPLDADAVQTQLTAASFDQTDPVVSNDRRLLAWISRDDIDGTNPDLSAEISVGDLVGTSLVRPRHVSRSPPGLDLDYLALQWRRR
jgi:Tol biopolymer transport system component